MKQLININEIVPTKSNIETVGRSFADLVTTGKINPVEFAIKAKFLKDALDAALKLSSDDIMQEVEKYGKDCTMLGARIDITETGVKYDYAQDEKWNEINDLIKPLQDQLKAQEERIKMATKIGADSIDTDTGELVAKRVMKLSTTSYKITLGK